MGGLNLYRPYSNDDWKRHAEQAFEAILRNELDVIPRFRVGGYKASDNKPVSFSATVTAFGNAEFTVGDTLTPAKLQFAQAADVSGDRGKFLNFFGLDGDGDFVIERKALNATNSSTAVETTTTWSALYAVIPEFTLGAQDISVYLTGSVSDVICTVPKSSRAGVYQGLVIPSSTAGTFTTDGTVTGGEYKARKARFAPGGITAVYNVTDDATRTTNLLLRVTDTSSSAALRIIKGHIPGKDIVLLTAGVGSQKTYEVSGECIPYQGVAEAGDEYILDWVDDAIYVATCGDGAPIFPDGGVFREYVAGLNRLPLSNGYADATIVGDDIGLAGLTDQAALGLLRVPVNGFGATSARVVPGNIVSLAAGTSAAVRGLADVRVDGSPLLAYGADLDASTPHGAYLLATGRLLNGENANVRQDEPVLLVFATTETGADVKVATTAEAYKLFS